MSNKYLQSFLDARLFNLGEDNTTYQNLIATIPLVEKVLSKDKWKITTYTLVLLDPDTDQEDPTFDEIEELLKRKWPLLRNRYNERPTTLLRSLIIEVLHKQATTNPELANAMWLTGSNMLGYLPANAEGDILTEWLKEIGGLAEDNALQHWELMNVTKAIHIPPFSIGKMVLSGVTLDKEGLKTGFSEAANNGHQLATVQTNYNNSGSANLRAEWAEEFSTKSAQTLFDVFSKGFNSLSKSINTLDFDKPINEFFNSFRTNLHNTLTATVVATDRLRLRNDILWWKEALYSSSARKSYREMEPSKLSLTSAIDLAIMIQAIYPNSVDYILKEVVLKCKPENDKINFEELSVQLMSASLRIPLEVIPGLSGRISVSAFLNLVLDKTEDISAMKIRTGIASDTVVSYGQLAVMFLHDIQASRLVKK